LLCDKLYRLSLDSAIDARFLVWFFQSAAARAQLERDATGTSNSMQNVGQDTIKQLKIPLLPLAKQGDIADFLDRETARIDDLIAKKQRLIELLQERWRGAVTRAVTCSLDLKAEMKDSGVEWLPAIPKHWDVKRLKYLGTVLIGLTYNPSDVVDEGEGTLVLRASNIQDGEITFEDNVYARGTIPAELITRRNDSPA
jgi:type I restriction enzyme S subunit